MNRQIGQPHHQQQHRPSQAQGGGLGGQSILQAQRQALQSHIAAQSEEAPGLSEAIELPDIKSEYSDSDDEDRDSSKQALPSWAQSPEIRNALREQESHNPDDIFGPMKPLSMEEVFRARAGKFRARSSSANWGGTDRLTPQEESDYARRMGFK
ncbi:inner centromere protein [Mrakia frigida]|uniref:Sli15p n=1 Tax=Mrakia frigida TaxID=29902 RepID=UPI003FCBFC90